jgi:hypothetical protein
LENWVVGGVESFLMKKFSTTLRLLPEASVWMRMTMASVVTPFTLGAAL